MKTPLNPTQIKKANALALDDDGADLDWAGYMKSINADYRYVTHGDRPVEFFERELYTDHETRVSRGRMVAWIDTADMVRPEGLSQEMQDAAQGLEDALIYLRMNPVEEGGVKELANLGTRMSVTKGLRALGYLYQSEIDALPKVGQKYRRVGGDRVRTLTEIEPAFPASRTLYVLPPAVGDPGCEHACDLAVLTKEWQRVS